jgi:RNA polymerase sigma-70 factor (ECF subfamily)
LCDVDRSDEPGHGSPLKIAEPPAAAGSDFEAVMLPHRPALLAVALRLTGNPSEAHDLVQDTYERALRRYGSFVAGTNGRAWLVTILQNLFVDRCRRASVRPAVVSIDNSLGVAAPEPAEPEAWAAITMEQLDVAVNQLSPEFREVFRLHAIERRSYEEISRALGIPKATIGTRLLRARKKLRALLHPGNEEDA